MSGVRVPTYDQQTTVGGFGPIPTASAVPESPAIGQGLGDLGTALQTVAHIHNETAVNDVYTNQFSPAFRDLYQKYYSLQGKDAPAQMADYANQMQELRQQTRQSLQNPAQQRMFDMQSTKRIEYEMDGMARYADQQNKVYQGQTSVATLQNLSNQAADKYNDDQAFGTAIGSGIAEVERYGMSIGEPPEKIRADTDKFISGATLNRVQRWMVADPVKAQDWYNKNSNLIEAANRPVIEHQLKSAVQPIEAKGIADQAIQSILTTKTLTGEGAGTYNGGAFIGLKGDPDEIARQVAATTSMSAEDRSGILAQIEQQKSAAGGTVATANTRVEVMAKIGDGLSKVQALADQKHPGDPVFADLATQQFMGHLNRIAQATLGASTEAHATVMTRAIGLDGKAPPTTPAELLSDPAVAQAWPLLTPESQRGFVAANGILAQNARAASGEFTKSDPTLVNSLRQRIYLPDGDPNKLTNPTQLTPYFANGLNYTDSERIKKEMTEANTPEGNPFLKQVNGIKHTAQKMLTGSMSAVALRYPEMADEAAYRFGVDLDNKIIAARKAGKDPHDLFVPGSKDYVLDPSRVAAFMPTEAQITAAKASKGLPPSVGPVQASGESAGDYAARVARIPGETPAAYLARIGK